MKRSVYYLLRLLQVLLLLAAANESISEILLQRDNHGTIGPVYAILGASFCALTTILSKKVWRSPVKECSPSLMSK
ncbi:hypothetical protein BABINDRAFT_163385 [Babjeviella inositovora NRRL Y-12698]|uniref:Uncharacterized protein n=1 Tax=Babjeviella inositovora NRRL Y-12698 TaxID=984486 RepID=A0A1E3QIX4_9ASCO|nr:uncharacterized protein BABINDRAFT_163385 [Babjeviella inositovora NRRL Y-12698]ODQ77673.1 hypothetical protein BABINDRAFT_163385 [Babjeviella inositovora NRRL Y-12698]